MNRHYNAARWTCVLSLILPWIALAAQPKVDSQHLYERIWVVVPMVGKGTLADPKRPMYAPTPLALNLPLGQVAAQQIAARTGIIGYSQQVSDDGKFALVEFVARDRSAFKDILADTTVKSFSKGRDKKEDVEAEFKKYKKDFDFNRFGVRLP